MFSTLYSFERSIKIALPAAQVYEKISDLQFWPQWSPWYCLEPDSEYAADANKSQVGQQLKWNGKIIGSGEMKIVALEQNKKVNMELQFLTPFKSQSLTSFILEEQNGHTQLTWTMQSSLPFFLFFLKKIISAMIGQDFERGLLMLKEILETGSLPSQIKVQGQVHNEGFYYIGYKFQAPINELGPPIQKAFNNLNTLVMQKQIPSPEFALNLCHRFDFVKNQCEITVALGYSHPTSLADTIAKDLGLEQGEVPKHTAYRVDHIGAYRFIRNAWASVMSRQRVFKLKENKKIVPYEVYRTLPEDIISGRVAEKDYLTEVIVPLS
jgi:hypothetical protein